jgi:hypothetical protein
VGYTERKLSFFVMVPAFSRQMFVEFTVSQTMEHFLACHQHGYAVADLGAQGWDAAGIVFAPPGGNSCERMAALAFMASCRRNKRLLLNPIRSQQLG